MSSNRIKAVGVYRLDNFSLIATFASKAKAVEFQDSYKDNTESVYYYNIYPSQVEVLGYAQASDLELIIGTAKKWRESNE